MQNLISLLQEVSLPFLLILIVIILIGFSIALGYLAAYLAYHSKRLKRFLEERLPWAIFPVFVVSILTLFSMTSPWSPLAAIVLLSFPLLGVVGASYGESMKKLKRRERVLKEERFQLFDIPEPDKE